MTKKKVTAKVLSQKKIGPDIYDLWMSTELAETARPGQFVCVYPKDKSAAGPPHQYMRGHSHRKHDASGIPEGRKGNQ